MPQLDPPSRSKTTTQADLARELGIAKETVSRALNEHPRVSSALKQRVQDAAKRLKYRPNAAALAMKHQRFRQIGVVIPDDPQRPRLRFRAFKMETIAGVNVTLEEAGYSALLLHAGGKTSNTNSLGRILRENAIDGAIVCGTLPDNTRSHVESLTDHTVYIESDHWASRACFRRDEEAAGRIVGDAIVENGYRRIVWFKGDLSAQSLQHFSVAGRRKGLSRVAQHAGLPIREFGHHRWEMSPDDERDFFASLDPHTAVVCYDAANARWFQAACLRQNARPGHDFGLACCDDIHEFEYTWDELSRVAFDRYSLGSHAAQKMLDWLDGGKIPHSKRVIDPWLPGSSLPPRN
ncbi:MAG: LacI family DNA-binding transcriptional regulator [Planctomycetota bacterium]